MVISFIAGLVLLAIVAVVYVGIPIAVGSYVAAKIEPVAGRSVARIAGIMVGAAIVIAVFQFLPINYTQPYDRF